MKARITIDVKDRKQARAIQVALARPDVCAFAILVGTLDPLSDRARARVLNFIADKFDEDQTTA